MEEWLIRFFRESEIFILYNKQDVVFNDCCAAAFVCVCVCVGGGC